MVGTYIGIGAALSDLRSLASSSPTKTLLLFIKP